MIGSRGGSIDRLQWNNRFNGHGRTGYSTGNGGTISWTLRKVADPKATPVEPGPVLGETRRVTDPATSKAWIEEFHAAGGRGNDIGNFSEYPTIRLQRPVEVTKGEMLLFTQLQHNQSSGTVSINNNYSTCRSLTDWSPFALHKTCRQLKNELSRPRSEHFPVILIGYTDGTVKGTGVMGYAAGLSQAEKSIELGGDTRARQVFTVPTGRTAALSSAYQLLGPDNDRR